MKNIFVFTFLLCGIAWAIPMNTPLCDEIELLDPYEVWINNTQHNEEIFCTLEDQTSKIFCQYPPQFDDYVSQLLVEAKEENKYLQLTNCSWEKKFFELEDIKTTLACSKECIDHDSDWVVMSIKEISLKRAGRRNKKPLLIIKHHGCKRKYPLFYMRNWLIYSNVINEACKKTKHVRINFRALKSVMRQKYLCQDKLIQVSSR